MKIEVIPGANANLGAPIGWDAEREGTEVLGLPCIRHEKGFVSQWRPSAEELERLMNGAPIWLHVLGGGHPPVAVTIAPVPVPVQENADEL
ncbi:hypothetical protein VW35_02315 [Devosia soli]|uniref:Uncharacterized protein n=1 Tax=Devosia soli TaxID=361041 RepID=A0A0F5LFR5_9HYPH|nr:hypothetical protein [Devosia soli]KKB81024.1 hypothetical protein VW35_02315 [Devosia soli]